MNITRMRLDAWCAVVPALALVLASPQPASSQAPPQQPEYGEFLPDPANVKFVLPENIPWTGTPGRLQQHRIMGDPSEPGSYILLLKWWPNQFSRPHIHEKTRYIAVVSGTWWMSSSPLYDPANTYPLPAGTVVIHEANKVHWDGAKDEPAVLMIVGEGPVSTILVDEQGKPH